MLFAIDRLIDILEKVSNFHQGYVSNAYPCLHVVKEQIFISSAKHTPGAYHPKICWILLTSDHITKKILIKPLEKIIIL